LYDKECLQLATSDPESVSYYPNIKDDLTTDKDVALNTAPVFQGMKRDGVKVYLLNKLEDGFYAIYREKKVDTPIGYLGEDMKTLYAIDKQKRVKKLSEL
jgi:hypothetical protein